MIYTVHCEFCGKDFQTQSAVQKWHNCEKALEYQRIKKNEHNRKWKKFIKNNKSYVPVKRGKKEGMKRCITPNCLNMTPNYFGRCDSCLAEFERTYDINFLYSIIGD
jgi:hypothetical protein